MIVHNASSDPVSTVRLLAVLESGSWGPQLLGTLQPSQTVTLAARVASTMGPDANAIVRFFDIEERPLDRQHSVVRCA